MKSRAFVFVHGAWHGGWCYSRVADMLRAKGHHAFTPTLTGVGERAHLAALGPINCSTHIQDIVNVMRYEQLNEVIICGHSYGGLVAGAAADAAAERIAAIVYLDGSIPEDGKSMFDLADAPDLNEAVLRAAAENGGALVPPFPAKAFGVPAQYQAMVDSLCTPQPLTTFCERIRITGACANIPKKAYILATGWEASPNRPTYERVKKLKDWSTYEVDCGHDVMIEAPERLAEILLDMV